MSLAPPAVSESFQAGESLQQPSPQRRADLKLPVTIASARPEVKLIGKSFQRTRSSAAAVTQHSSPPASAQFATVADTFKLAR